MDAQCARPPPPPPSEGSRVPVRSSTPTHGYTYQTQQLHVPPASLTPGAATMSPNQQTTLKFTTRTAKQPLYCPAVLRRNDSPVFDYPSPPISPGSSSSDLHRQSSWLSSFAHKVQGVSSGGGSGGSSTSSPASAAPGVALPWNAIVGGGTDFSGDFHRGDANLVGSGGVGGVGSLGFALPGLSSTSSPVLPSGGLEDVLVAATTTGVGRGTTTIMLPKTMWKADEEAVECADQDCTVRFGLIDRKHHCRRCGDVYCSTHSSRILGLWPPVVHPSHSSPHVSNARHISTNSSNNPAVASSPSSPYPSYSTSPSFEDQSRYSVQQMQRLQPQQSQQQDHQHRPHSQSYRSKSRGLNSVPQTPNFTPRSTPRSSALDIPSLAYTSGHQDRMGSPSSTSTTSTARYHLKKPPPSGTSSPSSSLLYSNHATGSSSSLSPSQHYSTLPIASPPPMPTPTPTPTPQQQVNVRVCDSCFFNIPPPSQWAQATLQLHHQLILGLISPTSPPPPMTQLSTSRSSSSSCSLSSMGHVSPSILSTASMSAYPHLPSYTSSSNGGGGGAGLHTSPRQMSTGLGEPGAYEFLSSSPPSTSMTVSGVAGGGKKSGGCGKNAGRTRTSTTTTTTSTSTSSGGVRSRSRSRQGSGTISSAITTTTTSNTTRSTPPTSQGGSSDGSRSRSRSSEKLPAPQRDKERSSTQSSIANDQEKNNHDKLRAVKQGREEVHGHHNQKYVQEGDDDDDHGRPDDHVGVGEEEQEQDDEDGDEDSDEYDENDDDLAELDERSALDRLDRRRQRKDSGINKKMNKDKKRVDEVVYNQRHPTKSGHDKMNPHQSQNYQKNPVPNLATTFGSANVEFSWQSWATF